MALAVPLFISRTVLGVEQLGSETQMIEILT